MEGVGGKGGGGGGGRAFPGEGLRRVGGGEGGGGDCGANPRLHQVKGKRQE